MVEIFSSYIFYLFVFTLTYSYILFFAHSFIQQTCIGCWSGSPGADNELEFFCFVLFFIYLFILFYLFYFWLCWVFVAVCGLSSSCSEWVLLLVVVHGLLIVVASCVVEHGL